VTLLSITEINERLGFGLGYSLLWASVVIDVLGVPPTVNNAFGAKWTEEQFIEICRRLRNKLQQQIDNYDEEL
jgi:hypothetical protein